MSKEFSQLPPEIHGRSAWYGRDLSKSTDWIFDLSDSDVDEIERATKAVANCSFDLANITKADFPLPNFSSRLKASLTEVQNGRGFVLIRGLPLDRWSIREAATAFLGIGVHLGSLRSQNAAGHLLGHVKDLGYSSDDPNVRIYQTRERQTHHTDSCDIVGLLCLSPAKSGGLSSIVSSVTIFNEMRRRRPDLAQMLFDPIETDRRGEVPPGQKPYFEIPVFNWHANLLSAIYQRQYIESARRFDGVPPLTSEQIEALDMLDNLANDPELNLTMELKRADVQFVHNHTILHDRTAFEDWPERERKRYLLRLWLAPENARPLPDIFAERFGSVTPGDRGGVTVLNTKPTVLLNIDDLAAQTK